MKHLNARFFTHALLLAAVFFITGCDESKKTSTAHIPEEITSADECHICGMNIVHFPGPKGQAFIRHQHSALKFCSTVELFGWLLQPDTPAILDKAYVHDMGAATAWKKPDEQHYVEVTKAWYVAGHNQYGAMGPTLASFKEKQQANIFIKQHGGRLLGFSEIDLKVLLNLQQIPEKQAEPLKND